MRTNPIGVFVTPKVGELSKFWGVYNAFPNVWRGSVLDVGSRSGKFRDVLSKDSVEYTSLDIVPPADIIGNLDGRLPIEDDAFDVVVALDVLEHTNDIHHAFHELLRVARKHVVLSLPNALNLRARLRLASGRHISEKYGLPVEPPSDRHRWFFSLSEARAFCTYQAQKAAGWRIADDGAFVGARLKRIRPIVARWPDALGSTYLVNLVRENEAT